MQQNNSFFTKKKWNLWFFAVPLLTISLVSLGVLIATGWYQIDYLIAAEFAKALAN